MSLPRLSALFLSALLISSSSIAQQAPQQVTSSGVSASKLLLQSFVAIVGNATLSDITLTGSARRIAGSDDETGTATLQAISNGSARLDLTFPSGTRSEISNFFAAPIGSWSGPDGVSHSASFHNLLAESAWFSPALAISRRISQANFAATYVGLETLNGQSVEHLSVYQTPPFPDPPGGPFWARLTQVDFYLDSTTLLPVAMFFNTHADDNALLDIPVKLFFSDYHSISGINMPFHVQKYVSNSLSLELQFTTTQVNSGLTASTFSVQ